MIKNRTRKAPYVIGAAIVVSTAALVFLGIRGIHQTEKEEYNPASNLFALKEDSHVAYAENEKLPLSYKFPNAAYQIDIPSASYQKTPSGICATLDTSNAIYIGNVEEGIESGVSIALNEFPSIKYSAYNRTSSYITPKTSEEGYLNEETVTYSFNIASLAEASTLHQDFLVAYEVTNTSDQTRTIIAGITDGKSKEAKDYIRDILFSMLVTLRENPDFIPPEERNQFQEYDYEQEPAFIVGEIDVEDLEEEVEKESGELKTQAGSDADKKDKKNNTSDNPSKKPEQTPVPEQKPEPTPTPAPEPAPEPTPEPTPEPQPSTPPPAYDQNDKSIKTFTCPMTDCAMSVTVTTGKYCPETVVTLSCPDGTVLTGASNGAGTYTFQTIALEGTYTVTTTCFSAVSTVNINAHFY